VNTHCDLRGEVGRDARRRVRSARNGRGLRGHDGWPADFPPPACQTHCTLPGSNSQGTTPGGGTVASMTSSLPTTGADLLAMGVAAVATLGVGAGTVVVARRRRAGDAA
jgi:hypothetical protein